MPHSTKKIKKRTSRAVVNQNNNLQTERNIKHSEWSALRIQTETLLFYYENLDKPLRWLSNKEGMMHGAPCRITKSTLQRWVKHYERYGEPKAITKQFISSRKGKKKLTHLRLPMVYQTSSYFFLWAWCFLYRLDGKSKYVYDYDIKDFNDDD